MYGHMCAVALVRSKGRSSKDKFPESVPFCCELQGLNAGNWVCEASAFTHGGVSAIVTVLIMFGQDNPPPLFLGVRV